MQIKRPVAVVAIVTETFKKELIDELEASIEEVNNNQQALDSQARRYLLQLQSTDLTQSSAFRRQVEVEKAKMDQVKAERKAQLEAAQNLEIGSEFPRGTVESVVDLNVGDNLFDRLGKAEIVVKDDVIVEIRGE
ncbi:MAG: hypothetical protein GYA63_08880 [Armatimonadetes bacterium]|jgi:hypothetical protein|nr:hypothetical protein [Armatimonadota bacterium]